MSSSSFTPFNRKGRVKISTKFKGKGRPANQKISWRARKEERRAQRDAEFLETVNAKQEQQNVVDDTENAASASTPANSGNQKTWYSLSVALPGSILNNAQSQELRSYLAGEIARSCGVFCVDEVVVFDETAKMTQQQVDAYYSGSWTGSEYVKESSNECNFHLARILEYLECPQYLRKSLFQMQMPLKFAGLLNPLDGMHHLRGTDLSAPYREGITLYKQGKGRGTVCDVGLSKELLLNETLAPGTRVTIKVVPDSIDKNRLEGTLTSSKAIRKDAGIYWGYTVRIAKSLSDVLSKKYDLVIGTSERGTPVYEFPITYKKKCRILIVFGGLEGLEAAVDADEAIQETDPAKFFEHYINSLVDQGSRSLFCTTIN